MPKDIDNLRVLSALRYATKENKERAVCLSRDVKISTAARITRNVAFYLAKQFPLVFARSQIFLCWSVDTARKGSLPRMLFLAIF